MRLRRANNCVINVLNSLFGDDIKCPNVGIIGDFLPFGVFLS